MSLEGKDTGRSNDWRQHSPLIGFAVGGCLIPLLLFTFGLVVLGDVGGPLFWPIIALPLAIIGFLAGFAFRKTNKRDEGRKDDLHNERTD